MIAGYETWIVPLKVVIFSRRRFGNTVCWPTKVMTSQQQPDSLNSGYKDHQDICSARCESIAVEVMNDARTCESVHVCLPVIQWNSSISPLSLSLSLPLPSPLCLLRRWFISPGCVLSTSRPPRCTAVSESPVVSTAWRCSSGAPSSCPTMMISFTEAAPVLYAQVLKKVNLLFVHSSVCSSRRYTKLQSVAFRALCRLFDTSCTVL